MPIGSAAMQEEAKKQLLIEIDLKFHSDIKQRAAKKNMSMKSWILSAVKDFITEEDKNR